MIDPVQQMAIPDAGPWITRKDIESKRGLELASDDDVVS